MIVILIGFIIFIVVFFFGLICRISVRAILQGDGYDEKAFQKWHNLYNDKS